MIKKLLSRFFPATTLRPQNQPVVEMLEKEIAKLKSDNQALELFFNQSTAYFNGHMNCWKAQQEFRDLVISGRKTHADALDDYLGTVVDAALECMKSREMPLSMPWSDADALNYARGTKAWRTLKEDNAAEGLTTSLRSAGGIAIDSGK